MSVLQSVSRRFDRLGYRFAFLLAIALLPVGLIAVLQTQAVLRESEARSQAAIVGVTLRAANREVQIMREAQGAAAALAEAIPVVLSDPVACNRMMENVQIAQPQYSLVAYVGPDLRMRCSSSGERRDLGGDITAQRLLERSEPQIFFDSSPPISPASILAISHPVAETGGYVTLSVPKRLISAPREDEAQGQSLESSATFMTYTSDGDVLTTSGNREESLTLLPINRNLAALAPTRQTTFTDIARDGTERVYAAVPVMGEEIFALGSWPTESPSLDFTPTYTPMLLPVLMWLASLFVAWFAAERLVIRHIRKLRSSMSLFAQGGRLLGDLRMESAPREMREVAESFVGMTDTILRDEADLENALRQKEVLLREVHHRVKNNLQLIASIMNLQMRTAHTPEARRLLRSLQERVMSLATVHKELYHTTGLTNVHADELVGEIVQQIVRLSSRPARRLDVKVEAARIDLSPDQAVPLALFVTEALTNAMKYSGAHRGEEASIRIALELTRGDEARLRIENTLSGAETAEDERGLDSGLGHRLLVAFATQLNGSHSAGESAEGWRVELTFPTRGMRKVAE